MPTVDHSEFFTRDELKCKCGCDRAEMDEDFMQIMDIIRFRVGRPIYLNSAYRCPDHNLAVGGVEDSPHVTGEGADVQCSGNHAHEILCEAALLGVPGIGVKQKGVHADRFLHLDTQIVNSKGTRPWVWSY